jgi:ABC-2 type transport system permease protein
MKEHDAGIADETEKERLLRGGVHFVVTIPEGFSGRFAKGDAERVKLRLDAAPDVKQEMLSLFQSQLLVNVMRLHMETAEKELGSFMPGAKEAFAKVAFESEEVLQVRFNAMEADEKPTSTQQSVPSWIVFGMFFVIIPMSTIFINERKQNTLMRLSAMNVSLPLLFAGKIVPYMVINQIQVWLMIAVGMYVVPLLGADALTLGNSAEALVMVSLGLSLAAIGMSVLIAVIVETVEQATTIGGIMNILMGAIGGVMVPKFVMPPAMQSFADVSPMSWGLEGFLDVFLRGLGTEAVLAESAALAGFGVLTLLIAAALFSYKLRRGM